MACSASREAEAGRVSASRAGGHAPRTGERVARKSASRACFCVTAPICPSSRSLNLSACVALLFPHHWPSRTVKGERTLACQPRFAPRARRVCCERAEPLAPRIASRSSSLGAFRGCADDCSRRARARRLSQSLRVRRLSHSDQCGQYRDSRARSSTVDNTERRPLSQSNYIHKSNAGSRLRWTGAHKRLMDRHRWSRQRFMRGRRGIAPAQHLCAHSGNDSRHLM